ncbi:hypothetical protein GCM10011400_23740 [Paraburkholderia caffeinilytica]|uniref:Transposase n=1 Tax=Paraburkholderia caffeinilytica TaxID=1761016 RepID=A0ABQ1MCF2_9BURK|nr:hypothetical protein GCM10011400_23740 [Paraburkholderia caffeinilytica]
MDNVTPIFTCAKAAPAPHINAIAMPVRTHCFVFFMQVSKRFEARICNPAYGRVSESSYRVQACQAWFSLLGANVVATLVPLPC